MMVLQTDMKVHSRRERVLQHSGFNTRIPIPIDDFIKNRGKTAIVEQQKEISSSR